MEKSYTLYQLNNLVREAIQTRLLASYWVQAEVAELRENRGHCYLELVEKPEGSHTPVARAQAVCWKTTWQVLQPYFLRVAGRPLQPGMKVLLEVHPDFHEAYGFKWIVGDIDPTFTLGDMARRRQEIIQTLKSAGIFDLQHELSLPRFCQRIAIISAHTAAGYGDFCRQLHDNDYGLAFQTQLFPATMQGERVEESIVSALSKIYEQQAEFDCVVIIRGGGATADMSGFDTLRLAEHIVNFPLPIITGIGHDRDESVLDLIACLSVKTPTAAAALLVDHQAELLAHLVDTGNRLRQMVGDVLLPHRLRLERHEARLQSLANAVLTTHTNRMLLLEKHLEMLDPQQMLRRGYSITVADGHIVRSVDEVKPNQTLQTQIADGIIESVVTHKSSIQSPSPQS